MFQINIYVQMKISFLECDQIYAVPACMEH